MIGINNEILTQYLFMAVAELANENKKGKRANCYLHPPTLLEYNFRYQCNKEK